MRTTTRPPAPQIRSRQKVASKRVHLAAHKFFIVLGAGLLIATCLYFGILGSQPSTLQRRDLTTLDKDDDSCRLVHSARDQCRFIKKHCPTDEAGFSQYLDLYYCQLPNAKPLAFIILTAWLGVLFSTIGIAASDFFCVDLSTMAKILGMSESMAGVTLLAFGNGSPDVFSTFAAMSTDTGDLAVGELMGAACFITAVVAGSMAIIRPFKVSKKSFVRDVCFFAVAAGFTVLILSDGLLHLWECFAMIGYYVFYVSFVLFWHWYDARRKRRNDIEAAARDHYATTEERYTDNEPDPDEPRPATLRAPSNDDFAALERSITDGTEDDYSDEERDRWMSELNNNMRLSKPSARSRSSTMAPIRPSLVGALEFQAVLKSFQRARNMQSVPLNTRRYSDDPNLRQYDTDHTQQAHRRASIDPGTEDSHRPALHVSVPELPTQRSMAYTAVEAPRPGVDQNLQWRGQGHVAKHAAQRVSFRTPVIEVSQHSPELVEDDPFATRATSTPGSGAQYEGRASQHRKLLSSLNSPSLSPLQSTHRQPQIVLPSPPRSRSATRSARSPASPFPAYRDNEAVPPMDALALPPPVVDSEPETLHLLHDPEVALPNIQPRRWRWWPYKLLPSPESLACVLFPTLTDWSSKGIWARSLAVVAAPSVFLLVITLPVVETEEPDVEDDLTLVRTTSAAQADHLKDSDDPDSASPAHKGHSPSTGVAGIITAAEQQHLHKSHDDNAHLTSASPASEPPNEDLGMSTMQHGTITEDWPRWLLLIQLYMAPLTVVFSVFVQSPEVQPASWLLQPCLISLLLSTILLIPVLLTTSPTYRPRQYRWILSLAGFAVSIAWISTIASQVVGTLKALAIILNWSNAIMGLTIFAVGNSVSDLVADVTVANLGYPVMALSACFGGPMLNILLGIGLSGTYTILHGADRRKHKHPDRGFKIKTYHLDVGQTLIVSGIALLVTLVGVLVFVPLSNWMMTRKIGIALILVWILSTIGNVVIEVTGIADVSKTLT